MTYGLKTNSKIASDKQINFILGLDKERNTSACKGDTVETIMNAMEGKIVTSSEASGAITDLLAQPKIIKTQDAVKPAVLVSTGLLADVPLSNYAVEIAGEGLVFLKVAEFKGTRYVRQLIGSPGDWKKIKPVGARRAQLIAAIKAVGPQAAAARYGEEFTCCGVCSSPLSDELSRARKIGPQCWKRFH